MGRRIQTEIEVDGQGHLILPPELLAEYGIFNEVKVRLEKNPIGFSFSRSTDNLSRIYIEPTNLCNLTCTTCMRNSWKEPQGFMDEKTFEKILASMKSISPKPSIVFGGFGEPLTHPDILYLLAGAKRFASSVEIITNGILLTPEVIRQVVEMELDRVWVSLDGATPESYSDVRLGDELPHILDNLANLRKATKYSEAELPRLGIAYVAMKRNIKDLPELIEIGKRYGADKFSISNVLPYSKEMVDQALYTYGISPYGYSPASRWLPELMLPRMKISEEILGPVSQAVGKCGSLTIARQEIHMGADTCPFIEKGSLSIRWDGEVSPCQALLHENKSYLFNRSRTTLAHSFGNVNNQTINEIWRQPEYAAFRDRVLGLDFSFCALCNSCDMADTNEEDCFGSPFPTCGGCLWAQGLIQCP